MVLRAAPYAFIPPCLPSRAERPPSGPDWVHEIKHDGYRLMARRDPVGIRLLTRNGHDWAPRYPLIIEAVNRLKARSCLIDGEAVACDKNGLAVFERLRRKPTGKHVFLYAFDLLELDGEDLRREPLETRKATLASLLRGSLPGLRLNEHLAHERIPARLQDGPRGHRVEAAWLALPERPVEGLAEVQESGGCGGEARGRGGVG
jgi:ATP-dependent DNA ligase